MDKSSAEQLLLPGLRPFTKSYRPRPTRGDVLPGVAETLADRIAAGWEDPGRFREEWVASLLRALEDGDDTWSLCRALVGDGWDVDDDLMGIMGEAWRLVDRALLAAEAEWVEDAQVTLALPVGTHVEVDLPRHGRSSGEIVGRDPVRATYTVAFPSLGHVGAVRLARRVLPAESLPGGVA
jgi:hypothetical protein